MPTLPRTRCPFPGRYAPSVLAGLGKGVGSICAGRCEISSVGEGKWFWVEETAFTKLQQPKRKYGSQGNGVGGINNGAGSANVLETLLRTSYPTDNVESWGSGAVEVWEVLK